MIRCRTIAITLLLTLLAGVGVRAQYIRLTDVNQRTALYYNLWQTLTYNRYEGWRVQAALYWVSPNYANVPEELRGPQWQVLAYGAYGLHDHGYKYGFNIARSHYNNHRFRPFLEYVDDIVLMASPHIHTPTASQLNNYNLRFGLHHFAHQRSIAIGNTSVRKKSKLVIEGRYMYAEQLFDNDGRLYPHRETLSLASDHFIEGHLQLSTRGITADLRSGTSSKQSRWVYARMLMQYKSTWVPLWNRNHRIDWITTGGYATSTSGDSLTTLQRMMECYDMGDVHGSIGYLRPSQIGYLSSALLTLPAESFAADGFLRTTVRYRSNAILLNEKWSAPKPFVQGVALAGHHYRFDEWSAVAETSAGVTGLIRWVGLELGFSTAFQILNKSSGESIRPDKRSDRWAFMVWVTDKF